MKDKQKYYSLDKIGFVGTQEKRDRKFFEKDIRDTVHYIKSKKAGNNSIKLKRQSTTASASKVSQ